MLAAAIVVALVTELLMPIQGRTNLSELAPVMLALVAVVLTRARGDRPPPRDLADAVAMGLNGGRQRLVSRTGAARASLRTVCVVALLAVGVLALPPLLSNSYVDALTRAAIYSVAAIGLGAMIESAGVVSLGQVGVLAVGAWVSARLLFATSLRSLRAAPLRAAHDDIRYRHRVPGIDAAPCISRCSR